MYYVYVLQSAKDHKLYIGYTDNLKRRFDEHNSQKNKSTAHRTPFQLVYYESYQAKADAKYRERQLKRYSQAYTALKKRIRYSITG